MSFLYQSSGCTHPRFLRPFGGAPKRVADVLIAVPILIFVAPLMVLIAFAVKLQDGGPVLFIQNRVGLDGASFPFIKFRTMVPDAPRRLAQLLRDDPRAAREWETKQKLIDDPRVTPLGRVLRRTSLDELPQFINVVLGHMSVVGPRPMMEGQVAAYGAGYAAYCTARPGITGLWQVSGRSRTTFRERSKLDQVYLRQWSLALDLVLVLRTLGVFLGREDAC
jgi:lipopolysaccharide/colanic/teichoic acid biosynthesis glycosyltransferase